MKAYIYTGGRIYPENIAETPQEGDLVIAVDSGLHNALQVGARPRYLIGDMDSVGGALPEGTPKDLEKVEYPPEKDATDTQLAVEYALDLDATEIIILGGLTGRLDHTMSNLAILEDLGHRGIPCVIADGANRVRFLNGSSILLPKSNYKYVSLLALDKKLKGVTIEGCRYPLKKATLERDFQYAVSNEITGNCALISLRKGAALLIESRDSSHLH
jgi:thiamine pyrophosphokinase